MAMRGMSLMAGCQLGFLARSLVSQFTNRPCAATMTGETRLTTSGRSIGTQAYDADEPWLYVYAHHVLSIDVLLLTNSTNNV